MFPMLVLKAVLTKEFQNQFCTMAGSMVSMYTYLQICYPEGDKVDLSSGLCEKAHSPRSIRFLHPKQSEASSEVRKRSQEPSLDASKPLLGGLPPGTEHLPVG